MHENIEFLISSRIYFYSNFNSDHLIKFALILIISLFRTVFLYNPLDSKWDFFFNLTEKVMDTIIVKLNKIKFFFCIHYSWKISTNCSELGSIGQISIIQVEAN